MKQKQRDEWPSADEFRRLLDYTPDDGLFRWSMDPENGTRRGRVAGCKAQNGYRMIRVLGKLRLAHRIAWTIYYGKLPEFCIDHVNRIRDDNRIANLRDVPQSANMKNTGARGVLVAAVKTDNGAWKSQIHRYAKLDTLGEFSTPDEANAAWNDARKSVRNPNAPRPQLRPVPQRRPRLVTSGPSG